MISKSELESLAKKLMFEMNDDEYKTLENEFDIILKQMDLIGKIEDIDDVSPMTFPFECSTTYLREDVPGECLKQEEALKNAKDVVDGQIRLPKVVG